MKDVILIDAGTGNLRSVQKALESIGASVLRTEDPKEVLTGKESSCLAWARSVILCPGCADADWKNCQEIVERGIPLLGICVGMQALFEVGEEMGEHEGLGLLRGQGHALCRVAVGEGSAHGMESDSSSRMKRSSLIRLHSGAYVYFNHSYYCQAGNPSDVIGDHRLWH